MSAELRLVAPQNAEAEESVLGAMLLGKKAVPAVVEILEPHGETRFFRASHGLVYQACRALHLAGHPVDPVTVAALLERQGRLSEAGGKVRVNELAGNVTMTANAVHYARIVRSEWERRELLSVLEQSARNLRDGQSARHTLAATEKSLLDVRLKVEPQHACLASATELADWFEQGILNPPSESLGIPGPWPFVARMMPSRLYVLAGYTGAGKTALACQFVDSACHFGCRVGYVSLEMSKEDMTDRLLSAMGPLPYGQTQSKRFGPIYADRYQTALSRFRAWDLDIIDDPTATASSVLRYQRQGAYDLLIVDHLHRFTLNPKNYRLELEREVRQLVNVARQERVPVLLLAQLSRDPHGGAYPRPRLSSLRDSAVIEQEAWQVAFVWRKADEKNLMTDEAEWIVAKNRSGPTGSAPLRFLADEVRYEAVT